MKLIVNQMNNPEPANYEKYLESVIDTIREGLLILDKDLYVISANRSFYQKFKVTEDETEKKHFFMLGNGQWNIPELRRLLEEILPEHNPFNDFRVEHNFPHIGRKIMLLNARQIKQKGRWKDRILLAIEDITAADNNRLRRESDLARERKIEKALKQSAMEFKTLADNIPNLCWMAYADGQIYWYNSRWYEYTGTTPAQMENDGWKRVHDPYVLPKVIEKWEESLKHGILFEMIFPIRGADNTFRPFLTRVVPVKDEKGKILQWFGTNTDITKQIELEKQKDDFLGIASHELKTPVTSIKAYGQVLQTMFKKNGDTYAVKQLEKMDTQINKLTNLIGDLLDVTKIQAGRLEFHEENFDFNQLADEIVDELQLTTENHHIKKDFGKSQTIYGDRERLGQVITNFISNAIKYSPTTKDIIVTTSSDQKKIKLCVQDYGVGIPTDKKDKVFEQFYRLSGPKHNTVPGLGLGLYVSSEIIKRQGGRIWVESEEGKGSTFCFELPIKNH